MILLLLAGRFRFTDGGGEAAGPGERAGEEGEEADQAAQGLYHGVHFVQFPAMLVLIV